MATRHITHLIPRHVYGQLSTAQRARVVNHIRSCPACRATVAREERLAADLRRELPRLGQPAPQRVSAVWAEVWQEISAPRRPRWSFQTTWLPGLSVMLAVMLAVVVALPMLMDTGIRVEAAPPQARPLATASPTPGPIETGDAPLVYGLTAEPGSGQATLDSVGAAAASPVPMPVATVSPEVARGGGSWR